MTYYIYELLVSTVCEPGYVTDVVIVEDKPAEVQMEVSE